MLAGITAWIKSIVLIVLFASFLELLLPASSMQRFVRVVMGLLVMVTILSPVAELVQHRSLPPAAAALGGRGADRAEKVTRNAGQLVQQRDSLALEMYRNDLARQIRSVVMALDGVADAGVAVEVRETPDGKPGAVARVTVYIQPGRSGAKVAPVAIGPAGGGEELAPALRDKVAATVKELYQLRGSQVEVKKMI